MALLVHLSKASAGHCDTEGVIKMGIQKWVGLSAGLASVRCIERI